MCKAKILVVAPIIGEGKPKVNFQSSVRDELKNKEGKDIKVVFFHCTNYNSEDPFFKKKASGATMIAVTNQKHQITSLSKLSFS